MAGSDAEKPAVLIIGGLGYVGRFLALHIQENELASELRIVDKQLPELAWLAPEFAKACSRQNYIQADAGRPQHLARIFDRANGKEFDYVFNCGGETRYSQEDEVYRMRSHALSVATGAEAARRAVRCFVEVSTGMVYKPESSSPRSEGARLDPWSRLAKWKLKAEEDLAKTPGLNLAVLRLAHVYGPYTSKFLGTALCLARVYQSEQSEMKWLWTESLKTNTVHVEDVARAMWAVADWYVSTPAANRAKVPIYNVVDEGDTSQGTIAAIITDLFGIKTSFQGTLLSRLAKLQLDTVVDELNDDVLDPWAELQADAGTETNMPLSPFTEKELLKDTDMCMDGAALVKQLGFKYKHPKLTRKEVAEVIDSYKRLNWWP